MESSFWSWVYTEESQPVMCGILTDLNLHRFQLHQTLTNFNSLQDTPLWHDPLHNNLPIPIAQLLARYRAHMNIVNTQLRRALDTLDALGRHPPRPAVSQPTSYRPPAHLHSNLPFYFTSHKEQQTSPPLTPLRLHADQQTSPSLTPLRLNQDQQTTPRPAMCSTASQTDIHAIALCPSFARPHHLRHQQATQCRQFPACGPDPRPNSSETPAATSSRRLQVTHWRNTHSGQIQNSTQITNSTPNWLLEQGKTTRATIRLTCTKIEFRHFSATPTLRHYSFLPNRNLLRRASSPISLWDTITANKHQLPPTKLFHSPIPPPTPPFSTMPQATLCPSRNNHMYLNGIHGALIITEAAQRTATKAA